MTFREATSDEQKPPDAYTEPTVLNPATSALLQELAAIRTLLGEIHRNGERDEVPAPAMFRLPLLTHVRIRATAITIMPAAAGTYAVRVGTENRITFVAPANGVISIPAEITFERGIEIDIVVAATKVRTTSAEIADAFIFGYPE